MAPRKMFSDSGDGSRGYSVGLHIVRTIDTPHNRSDHGECKRDRDDDNFGRFLFRSYINGMNGIFGVDKKYNIYVSGHSLEQMPYSTKHLYSLVFTKAEDHAKKGSQSCNCSLSGHSIVQQHGT